MTLFGVEGADAPVSHIFSLLQVDHRFPARLDARGTWALSFPGSPHVRFGAAVAGSCWLTVQGERKPFRLEQGDGYLLTRGQPYAVGSDLAIAPKEGVHLFREHEGRVAYGEGEGPRTSLVSGRFTFDELSSELLLQVLPPIVHLKSADDVAQVLRAAIDMLDYETRDRRFGASLVTHHVAQIMLIQALRLVAAAPDHAPLGWLAALANRRIGIALRLMHEQTRRRWTVIDLAEAAGMSRSIFALRFKELTGSAPLDYLLHLRMRKASQGLRSGATSIASVAFEAGYHSESAFSNAFKRVMGMPPKTFRALNAPTPSSGSPKLKRPE